MANLGVQWNSESEADLAYGYMRALMATLDAESGVRVHDLAHYVDQQGYDTLILIAYWTDMSAFDAWQGRGDVRDAAAKAGALGRFREILTPRPQRQETLFSGTAGLEGLGLAFGEPSAEVTEHGYWGSARDRLAIAQTDALDPAGVLDFTVHEDARRVTVKGHDNVAIIRSGQDWRATKGKERELYNDDIEPVLRSGMDYLCNDGAAIGCYQNRYMRLVDLPGDTHEKSFGFSYWRSLADLEKWAEEHPSHLAIFGTFHRVVAELDFQLDLLLSHEIYVVRPDEQSYEYVNCHAKTGLLKAMPG